MSQLAWPCRRVVTLRIYLIRLHDGSRLRRAEITRSRRISRAFEAAFQERFDTPPPEELNTGHRLTIIASAVDVATERIIEYLVEFEVPVNVVFFRYFEDEGHRHLARAWLIDQDRAPEPTRGSTSKSKEPWVVPVRWLKYPPREQAFWKTGMYANQKSATKLRNRFTLDQLIAEFGLDDDAVEPD